MFTQNLITAWKSLILRSRQMTLGILGLIIGLSAFLLIVQYIVYEYSYDKFHTNGASIYRVDQKKYVNDALTDYEPSCGRLVSEALLNDFEEIQEVTRLHRSYGSSCISYKEKHFYEIDKCCYTEPSFFNIFSFRTLKGDKNDLLKPNAVFISETASKKYFENSNPIGEIIELKDFNGTNNYYVCGIYKDMPYNSHFQFDFLFSDKNVLKHIWYTNENGWMYNNYYTYILLKPGVKAKELQVKLPNFVKNHLDPILKKNNCQIEYLLKPLHDIHLNSNLVYEFKENGSIKKIYFLMLISIMILFISWSNYINSFTVKIYDRAKELSIKRVVGALNNDFAKQFLTESLLINIITVVLTLIIILFSYIKFNNIVGTYNIISIWHLPIFWMILLSVILLGTIIFGTYPILIISTFNNVTILKGKGMKARSNELLRKCLIIFQFICSVALIFISISVNKQTSYLRNKELGINIKQKLVISVPGIVDYGSKIVTVIPTLIRELKDNKDIENVSYSYNLPSMGYANRNFIRREGEKKENNKIANYIWVDREYINIFNIHLLAGENFPETQKTLEEIQSGKNVKALITESASKLLGFKKNEDAIHKNIYWLGGVVEVYGVVEDYHHLSLKSPMEPIVLFEQYPTLASYLCIEIKNKNYKETISFINNKYTEYFPNVPFIYSFLDQNFNNLYLSEIRFSSVINLFTIIVILISSIGLYSITSHVMQRKYKEIAIRKVFGASFFKLFYLSTKEITIAIIIAIIISLPLAYIWFNSWLNNFAYKMSINIWLFIIPIAIVLIITLITITFDTIKVIGKNPTDVLKEE